MNAEAFDPKTQIHEELDAGDYAVVFRRGSDYELATEHDHIDAAFAEDVPPRVVFHRPRHVFLRPSVLGDRLQRNGAAAVLDHDGQSVRLSEVEDDDDDLLHACIDDGPAALSLSQHPSNEGGVWVVHGFRFWSHIAWFADFQDGGTIEELTEAGELKGAPAPLQAAVGDPVIGLIDNGVNRHHEWMGDSVSESRRFRGSAPDDPQSDHGDHGTMVAGMIRQTAPWAKIRSYNVVLPERIRPGIADERHIIRALRYMKQSGIKVAVMAFGADLLYGGLGGPLYDAILDYVTSHDGGNVYAAAGNIADDGATARAPVYPAGYVSAVAVAGADSSGVFYPWSNGWKDDQNDGLEMWTKKDTSLPQGGWIKVSVDDKWDGQHLFTSLGVQLAQDGTPDPDTSTYVLARGTSLLVAQAACGDPVIQAAKPTAWPPT